MVGIYAYYRDGIPVYVGRSVDIERRHKQHLRSGRFLDCQHRILEETAVDNIYDKEIYWIEKLDTFKNGENKVIHSNTDIPSVRKKISDYMKKNNPMKPGMTNAGSFKNGHQPIITEERNKKISKNMRGANNHNYGKKGCFDHINSRLQTCEKCGMVVSPGNYARWHGDNCRRG